ncbi:hypothetical protein WJX72_004093 [[Myrmecia] bisecta]|uniref:Pyrroloquinoline quinone-dependent pyranose dehydrogenase beta-propeller domain-containing protein n=1 Tax=[Myrmecia] bisecta TaxID=41462 RepID=A0AAW1PY67_9CHLO
MWSLVVLLACLGAVVPARAQLDVSSELYQVQLPPGFTIDLYFNGTMASARQLAVSQAPGQNWTIVFVGTCGGACMFVYALIDHGNKGFADQRVTLLNDLYGPNGVAYRNGSLYVGQINNITHYDNADATALAGKTLTNGTLVTGVFDMESHHGLKYLGFGPDDKLYATLGAPCNECDCTPAPSGLVNHCTINRMNADGSGLEAVATGVRNSVGYDWHPDSNLLFFTDNGHDYLGANIPDDELNVVNSTGENFGFPYCHTMGFGDPTDRNAAEANWLLVPDIRWPGVGNNTNAGLLMCKEKTVLPAQPLGPHVAPLGMKFYRGSMFPAGYSHTAFIAVHGSWNRDPKIGYAVMNAKVAPNGTALEYNTFACGWLPYTNPNGTAWGRPVDLVELNDGALLLSDDLNGVVYRIAYNGPTSL